MARNFSTVYGLSRGSWSLCIRLFLGPVGSRTGRCELFRNAVVAYAGALCDWRGSRRSDLGQNWCAELDIYWLLEKITNGEDCLAVNRVHGEPLSRQFPLTGNKTEKFSAFAPSRHRQILYPNGYMRLMPMLSHLEPYGTGNN
jgi:hypothetical protein